MPSPIFLLVDVDYPLERFGRMNHYLPRCSFAGKYQDSGHPLRQALIEVSAFYGSVVVMVRLRVLHILHRVRRIPPCPYLYPRYRQVLPILLLRAEFAQVDYFRQVWRYMAFRNSLVQPAWLIYRRRPDSHPPSSGQEPIVFE